MTDIRIKKWKYLCHLIIVYDVGKDGVSMLSIDPNERVTPSGQHHPESLDSIGINNYERIIDE